MRLMYEQYFGLVSEQVDETDLKSVARKGVWVRFPPRPPIWLGSSVSRAED